MKHEDVSQPDSNPFPAPSDEPVAAEAPVSESAPPVTPAAAGAESASSGAETPAEPAPPDPWKRPYNYVLLLVWLGLLLGFVESTLTAILYFLHRCPLHFALYAYWIPFASSALICGAVGLLLWLLAGSHVTRLGLRGAMWLCGAPFFIFLIRMTSNMFSVRLELWAVTLLALGLAFQVGKTAARYPRGFYRLVLWSSGALVVLGAGAAVVELGGRWVSERWTVSHLPPASREAPNVLLIVLDTVRAKNMSLYGYPGPTTPNLERWARRGVVFDRAVSTAPWTAPSHASMFTGRDAHELSIDWTVPLQRTNPTLAEAMSGQGYLAGGVVSNGRMAGRQTGLDRGFAHYDTNRTDVFALANSSEVGRLISPRGGFVDAYEINSRFLHWLPQDRDRPFFAFVNYLDCHIPYMSGGPFAEPEVPRTLAEMTVLGRFRRASVVKSRLPARNVALAEDAYNGCLYKVDQAVDALLTQLEERGELENTFVIIVGDHGEQFGEHDLFEHSNSLYRPLLHVPLIILGPRHVTAGKRVSQIVSLRDLPATILDLLDLQSTDIPGDSFAGLLLEEPPADSSPTEPMFAYVTKGTRFPERFPNGSNPVNAVFLDNMHYILSDKKEQMYDFVNDPKERHNLVGSPDHQEILERCRRLVPAQGEPGDRD